MKLTKYEVSNNQSLDYKETCFPIIPVINAYAEENEEIELIIIESDNPNVIENKKILTKEIEDIAKEEKSL